MTDADLRDARILIVDDQEPNVLFLEGLLQQGGYSHWRGVLDPRAAAVACAEYRPDLILLDLIMPGLDGFGVLEALRPCLEAEDYLPVLVLTVDLTPESKRRALAAGAKDFLAKPLDATEVLLRVKNLLETRFLYRRLRDRADERIREQAALIDQANDAFLVTGPAGRIRFWSRGAEKLYGWPASLALGRDLVELLFKKRTPELEEASRALAATGRWEGEHTQVTRDGREIVVACRCTRLSDAAGRPVSDLAINTDITEKKKAEAKLMRAQRLENIDRLATGIAHDLNNIFASLTVGLDLFGMTQPGAPDDPLPAMLRAGVRRGQNLVRQVLAFSRGHEGPRRPVLLPPLVEDLIGLFRQTFPKSIAITAELPPGLWHVNADPTRLDQLVANLCINARDAMPDGGRLLLTARNERLDDPVPGLAPGRYVVLTVEDTGTGIPPELLERVFEPFFTTKKVGEGTGLGLATAQSIVRNYGGRIEVESAVGKGTRFTIYLPAVDAPAPAPPEPARPAPPGGKGELLLVVDDDPALLRMAEVALTRAGYRVLIAANGADAVALYARRPQEIRAVLTDMAMPVMDGAQTIRELRRLNPDVRVIAFSGLFTSTVSDQAVEGVWAVLPKPYALPALFETVRSVLDRAPARAGRPEAREQG